MAGMLTAIMNFARVSFAKGSDELRRLELGKKTVVIERSPRFILAVAVTGRATVTSLHASTHYALQTGRSSYSVYALLRALGVSEGTAPLIALALGGALLLASTRARDERHSFTLAIAAALVVSPVVWIHYLVLLFVPIAITRPRVSVVWLLPSAFLVFGSDAGAYGSIPRIALVLAVSAATLALLFRVAGSEASSSAH